MLQDVRRGMQGTTAKVIVYGIAITFALFGFESIVGGIGGEPDVAEVNGEGIPESQFQMQVERQKRQLLLQMGEAADPDLIDDAALSASVLEGMIQEKTLELDAENKGLYASLPMVDEYIRSMSEFQIDGEFSNQRMQSVLGSAGFSLNTFRETLAKQVVIDQSRSALIGSAFVLEGEKDSLLELDRQTRSFGMATLSASNYLDDIEVTDAEIQSYYAENEAQFEQPESVDIQYVLLSRDEISDVDVTAEEVERRYQQELEEFVGEEERRAAHILISIDDEVSESDALAKINEIQAKLDAGESFEALAQAESKDEGSAEQGGDLGFSARGVYVADFESALFELEEGQISEPVKTEFGYHLIKLLDVQTNEPPALAERYAALESELLIDKRANTYVDFSQQLADISYSSPDLVEPAEELGLELKEKFSVSRASQDPIFSNPKVQRALFSEEALKAEHNSDLIEVDEGVSLVFKVTNFNPASVKPLEQVASQIRETLELSKATERAESVGQAFIVRTEAGEAPALVAEDMGFDWEVKENIQRDDFSINADLLFKVFAMDRPETDSPRISGFRLNSGDYTLVALNAVTAGDLEEISIFEESAIEGSLSQSYGATDYTAYLESLESSSTVERL